MDQEINRQRQATIDRAIAHLRTADRATLLAQLAGTHLHEQYRQDPARLADELAAADPGNWPRFFGAWNGAQSVLAAAGLPY